MLKTRKTAVVHEFGRRLDLREARDFEQGGVNAPQVGRLASASAARAGGRLVVGLVRG